MRSLLLFLAFTYVLIVPLPALAQTSQGSSSGDQYDPNVPGDGTADGAVHAALVASGALQTPSEVAQATRGSSVSADESSSVPPSEGDAAFAEEGGAASSTESASAAEEGGATSSTESASAAEAQGES